MNKSARTRQYILERTAPVFNRKGFSGTSLSDLTEATGLTKGALYGNFKDKEEIAVKAFEHAMRVVRDRVRKSMSGKGSSKERLFDLLQFYAGYVLHPPVPGGCPLLNTAVEADDHLKFMRRALRKELNGTVTFVQRLLEEGMASGEFARTTDARSLAYFIFCSVEGAVMFSRAIGSVEPMDYVTGYCRKILEQISKQP